MDYIALKAELDLGHPDTGAYNVDNTLAAGELNAVNRTVNYPLLLDSINYAIRENGKWTAFRELADLQTVPGTYDNQSMREFMDMFTGFTSLPNVDMQGAYMTALLAAMVTETSMTAPVSAALSSLGEQVISRTVEIGIGEPNTSHVEYARTL